MQSCKCWLQASRPCGRKSRLWAGSRGQRPGSPSARGVQKLVAENQQSLSRTPRCLDAEAAGMCAKARTSWLLLLGPSGLDLGCLTKSVHPFSIRLGFQCPLAQHNLKTQHACHGMSNKKATSKLPPRCEKLVGCLVRYEELISVYDRWLPIQSSLFLTRRLGNGRMTSAAHLQRKQS